MMEPMDRVRRHLTSVPINVEQIIRDLGITLKKNADLPANISGHIRPVSGKYEIASSKADHYFRQRFTMAHELGHFLLHQDMIGEGVDDNAMYRSTPEGDFYNTAIEKFHEMQANSFAASILMPEELLRQEVATLREDGYVRLKALAAKFQVSPSAMRWRLKSVGLDSEVRE